MRALDSLATEPRWVAWRNEPRGADGKNTKIPYNPRTRKQAKANDSETWGTRAEAEAAVPQLVNGIGGGIGIELGDLGADLHLAGLDLDSCLSNGTVASWAKPILNLLDTYSEVSPSGCGLKAFFYVETVDVRPFLDRILVPANSWGCRRDVPGEDARDHGPAVECYLALRYFAVTDQQWEAAPNRLRLLDHDVLEHLAQLIPPAKSTGGKRGGDNSRSAAAFRRGVPPRVQTQARRQELRGLDRGAAIRSRVS